MEGTIQRAHKRPEREAAGCQAGLVFRVAAEE